MHLPIREALDPVGLFVIAAILYSILAPLFRALRNALNPEARQSDTDARRRLAQALSQTQQQEASTQPDAPASATAARRAAEIARLRRALLASAGLPEADVDTSQPQQYTVTFRPTVTPASTASTQPPALAQQQSLARSQTAPQPPPPTRSMPTMQTPLATLPSDWGLETPASLMTLESPSMSFERLPGATDVTRKDTATAAPAQLAILQGPQSGTNLFVAAAIVGPCAAFRPLGHTPGGW